jgi:hypothetical protein
MHAVNCLARPSEPDLRQFGFEAFAIGVAGCGPATYPIRCVRGLDRGLALHEPKLGRKFSRVDRALSPPAKFGAPYFRDGTGAKSRSFCRRFCSGEFGGGFNCFRQGLENAFFSATFVPGR